MTTPRLRPVDGWPSFVEWSQTAPARVIAVDGQSDDVFRWEAQPAHNDKDIAIAAARHMALPCIVRIQRPCSMHTYKVGYAWGRWIVV